MARYSQKQDSESTNDDEIVDALLRLPAKNLECRIKQLGSEITERQKLRNHALGTLGTHRLQLEAEIERLKYLTQNSQGWRQSKELQAELLEIQRNIIRETIACFHDVSQLQEKLQEAQAAFELAREKLKLIESRE